jgi:hypothetical protein
LSECLSNCIQDSLPVCGEAAQDENSLLADCVNHVADSLVVQKQVNELSDFKIIHLDCGFTLRRDYQVRLDCSLQPYVPGGCSIHGTSREICTFEISFDQSRGREVRPAEVRLVEVRLVEVRPAEVRPAEIRLAEVRFGEVRPVEVRPDEVRLVEVRPEEVCPAEVRLAEVRPAEVRPAEIDMCPWMLPPPFIPDSESLFKLREMFGIRRGASNSAGSASLNDTLPPSSAAVYRIG